MAWASPVDLTFASEYYLTLLCLGFWAASGIKSTDDYINISCTIQCQALLAKRWRSAGKPHISLSQSHVRFVLFKHVASKRPITRHRKETHPLRIPKIFTFIMTWSYIWRLGPEPALGISATVAWGVTGAWQNRKHEEYWLSIWGQRQANGFLKGPSVQRVGVLLY